MTPGPLTSRSVAEAPGATATQSLFPPVRSQLEERWHLYSRRRAMAKRASGAGGGVVGASGLSGAFLVSAEALRPRTAPAAASVPIILRRVGAEAESDVEGTGLEGSMGGIARLLLSVIQRVVRKDSPI